MKESPVKPEHYENVEFRIVEYYAMDSEVYVMTGEMAEQVFGFQLWRDILAGRWDRLYHAEIIN